MFTKKMVTIEFGRSRTFILFSLFFYENYFFYIIFYLFYFLMVTNNPASDFHRHSDSIEFFVNGFSFFFIENFYFF